MVVAWVVLPVMAQILQMRIFHDVTGGIYGSPPLPTGTQTYINESSTTLARTILARGSWPTHRPIELVQPYGYCITVIAGGILLLFKKSGQFYVKIRHLTGLNMRMKCMGNRYGPSPISVWTESIITLLTV